MSLTFPQTCACQWAASFWPFAFSHLRSLSSSLLFYCYGHVGRQTANLSLNRCRKKDALRATGPQGHGGRRDQTVFSLRCFYEIKSLGRLTYPSFRTKGIWERSCLCSDEANEMNKWRSCKQRKQIHRKGPSRVMAFYLPAAMQERCMLSRPRIHTEKFP